MFDLPQVRGRLYFNYPMASLSWLRVGGCADVLFQPEDVDDLVYFLQNINCQIPLFCIGVCSNLIIRDGGIRGIVIKLGREFNAIKILDNNRLFTGAAALDSHVARVAAGAGIDLAFLRSIPGTIGGAIKMNAGCYGVYMADIFESAEALTRHGKHIRLTHNDMQFAYRSSILTNDIIVTAAVLRGPVNTPDKIATKMTQALKLRAKTQPINMRSCGSTFRNPAGFSSTMAIDEQHDLKAWKLIDIAGMRGICFGGAQVSKLHSNFLVNTGNATALDLEMLGCQVQKKVLLKLGIELNWEIIRIGELIKS